MTESSLNKENIAFISLGSNVGNREEHLKSAINLLGNDENITIERKSSIYETDPVGYTKQQAFLNMVVKVRTSYTPIQLLNKIHWIEKTGGRERNIRWGPRTIDLDILLYNNENIKLEHLQVPHPRMYERGFVLIPLMEIEPNIALNEGKSINDYINNLKDKEGVYKWKNSFGGDASVHFES